jgi:DNA-directed RNA polymerase subunit L
MEIKIIKEEKDHIIFETANQTIAELLRVYLNEDEAVELAAWKKDHPDKALTFELRTKGKTAKKAIADAISAIEKATDKYLDEFKKAIK